jgi:nucleoside-diphosphate-sugar epimerase
MITMSPMRVFVAGGTGLVGRRITPLLVEQGHQVTVMTRSPERARASLPDGVRIVAGDVFDAEATLRAVGEAAPEVVMHQVTDLAARDSAANARVRIEGTRNLVEAALAAGVERMVAQSISWCYRPGSGPATEEVELDEHAEAPERQATVAAVAALETQTRRLPQAVVLRNGTFYGPGTWYWPDGLAAGLARSGQLPATPGTTSFVHLDDAARASVEALLWPAGTVNVVDDEPATGLEWAPLFARLVGAPEPRQADTAAGWERGASNRRARELGWEPRWSSWRTGFAAGAAERA